MFTPNIPYARPALLHQRLAASFWGAVPATPRDGSKLRDQFFKGFDRLVLTTFFIILYMQDKTEGEVFLQCLRSPTTGSHLPPSGLPRIWASLSSHIWHHSTSSIFDLWSKLQVRGPAVGSPWNSSAPPFFERGWVNIGA